MISITHNISGSEIATGLSDDPEETVYFLTEYTSMLNKGSWEELERHLEDCIQGYKKVAELKRLGELIIKVCK